MERAARACLSGALLGRRPPFAEVLAAGLAELDRVHQSLDEMGARFRDAEQGELVGNRISPPDV